MSANQYGLNCPRCGRPLEDGYADVKYTVDGNVVTKKEEYVVCHDKSCGFYCCSLRNLRLEPIFP